MSKNGKVGLLHRAQAARFFWSRTQARDAPYRRGQDALAQAAREWRNRHGSR